MIDETLFSIELMANDPTAKGIIDSLGMTLDQVKGVTNSVASMWVSGIKPTE